MHLIEEQELALREFITQLWALLTHAGVLKRVTTGPHSMSMGSSLHLVHTWQAIIYHVNGCNILSI
jgi:hypothetical protein